MNKNGQKWTSNLQMPVFKITDDRKALRSIFRIFMLYAGQHSCMYESSCLFSLDSFGKEIKRPSASGNILALEYCGQILCVPLGLTEKDKAEITKRFDKISFLVHGKQRRKQAIWDFLDSLYKYVNDTDMLKIVAVTTYKNMNQERKESKNGKELKALELPGLWNGAMSDWNTVFVEVPISTFNPVKTVNDLLREQHQ